MPPAEARDGAPAQGLPLSVKLAFGAGDVGSAVMTAVMGFFLNPFLLEVAGLRPAQAAIVIASARLWDSVNDPVIGTLSDRTRSRWGRRRPWLLFGAVPFGLSYFLLWLVPDFDPAGLFWYYLVVALLLDVTQTAVAIPYTAMTPELAEDYDQRTVLNSYRFTFSILSGLAAVFAHSAILGTFEGRDVVRGWMVSGAVWGAVIAASTLVAFAGTRERFPQGGPAGSAEAPLGFVEGVRIAFGNRAFRLVTALYLLAWLAIQFTQNNLVLYVQYWAGAPEQLPWLLLTLQAATFVFLMIWSRASERLGKKTVYTLGASVWIAAGAALFFVPAGNVGWLYAVAPVAAVGVSVCYLIPWSMLPDVVDEDELQTGRRREGVFYSLFVFMQKLGLSAGIGLSNLILEWSGYRNPLHPGVPETVRQPEAVRQALRTFVSLVPSAILLLSLVVVYYYPITRERHRAVQEEIRRRRAGEERGEGE
jgi:glycoside/pentoside/hexuronide:cation symporter, GPH family